MTGRPLRNRRDQQSGAISVMAAVMAMAMVMATSLAVDVGRVAYTSRDQQGATDRAVLDALRALPALHTGATGPGDVWDGVRDRVLDSLEGNEPGSAVGTSTARAIDLLEVGYVEPTTQQFRVMWTADGAGAHAADWATQSVDTIRLSTHSSVDFVFGVLAPDGARDVYRQAFGTTNRTGTPPTCTPPDPACTPTSVDAEATISVGSRLVEVETHDSILAPLLTELFGASSTLTLAGYDGLLTADVPLGVLGDAGADVGTVDALLASTNVNLRNLASVAASGLATDDAAVATDAKTALTDLSAAIDPMLEFDVDDVLVATTEDPDALLEAEVPLLDLLLAGAMAARAADGEHLLSVDIASGPLLGTLQAEGLSLGLTIIEPPQFAHGRARWLDDDGRWETRADTAQVELAVDLTLEGTVLDDLLDGVSGLVGGVLDSFLGDLLGGLLCPFGSCSDPAPATVRVAVSAARAEATLTSIDCQQPAETSRFTGLLSSQAASLDADLGVLDATGVLGDVDQLLAGPVTIGGVVDEEVVVDGVPGSASTAGGSALGGVPLLAALGLDTALEPVLGLLGIDLGTGQMGVHAVRCDVPVLLPNP